MRAFTARSFLAEASGRVGPTLGKWLAIGLLVLLAGSDRAVAQSASLISKCDEYAQQAAEQQSIVTADLEAVNRAEDHLNALHTTLRGYIGRLRNDPEQFERIVRAMAAVLQQIKQARADLTSVRLRFDEDDLKSAIRETRISTCLDDMEKARLKPPGELPRGSTVLILTVRDRTETVNLSLSNGRWDITSLYRQGIKLPSHDPAASDSTGPVKVSRAVTARVTLSPWLRGGWTAWLGIGVDTKTPEGPTLCKSIHLCNATSGPFPGVRRGFGKGWAASEAVEVWLCPSEVSCVGKTDPVATINISWVLP